MRGVLVVDKASGPTSFDVVRTVRSLLNVKKVGHTGTLDPLATGVLPICLGEATKIAGFITEGDKAYDAVLRLGVETDTLDAMGKVVSQAAVPHLTAERWEEVMAQFRGPLLQTPPMYSAVKQGGKRLYELARAGEEVERAPRPVTVYELRIRDFSADSIRLSVRCSKGFFVRVLAQDIGRALGCGAHLTALRRTHSGPFSLQQAVSLENLTARVKEGGSGLERLLGKLVSESDALSELPAVHVSAPEAIRVAHGIPLETQARGRVRVLDAAGRLLAVAEADRGKLHYRRVLLPAASRTLEE